MPYCVNYKEGIFQMRGSRRFDKKNWIGLILTTLIATAIGLVTMRVWEMDLNILPAFSGDGVLSGLLHKSIKQYGIRGLWFCEALGAPEVSALVDTPFLDLSYGLEAWLISKFVSSSAITYILYFLSYTLTAFFMYLLLNRFTDRVWLKSLLGVAFAVTPYHIMRGMGHLTLSRYHMVPMAIYLMLVVYEEDFAGIAPKRYKKKKWKLAVLYGSCLYIGLSNIYYAFFTLICIGMAVIGKLIRRRSVSCLWQEAVPIYAVLLGVLIGLTPKLYYSIQNGFNTVAGVRVPLEAEMYALKIIQLLLPCGYSRVGFLADLNSAYTHNAINVNENTCACLGFIASVGFLIACGWVILRLFRNDGGEGVFHGRMNILSLTVLVIVLYSMAGGFGTFVNYFITPEIRCLNRSSIFIVCMCLCVCCLCAEPLAQVRDRPGDRALRGIATALIAAFVLYSEVPINLPGWQDDLKKEDVVLREFFTEVESAVPEGSMIYELPFMIFPEQPPMNDMQEYAPALPFIYLDGLRWSYGGMRGRNEAAQKLYVDDGMSMRFVKQIIDAGFSGVYIDTRGYEDYGEAVNAFYAQTLGLTPIVSEDGWFYFYSFGDVTIDERIAVPGFSFVQQFAGRNGVDASNDEIAALAAGLGASDPATLDLLWQWAQHDNVGDPLAMSDVDYVLYLYRELIGRDEPAPEGWAEQLRNGTWTRKELFSIFLTCEEFRNVKGLNT